MSKKIDIVIPVYKAKDYLQKALASIAMQTIVDDITVYITVDGDKKGIYDKLFKPFKELMGIEVEYLDENKGPGYARQVAFEKGSAPYVMFVDADDSLANAYACSWLYNTFAQKKYDHAVMIVGQILEESKDSDGTFYIKDGDLSWVTGKLYKRKFLEEKDIKFSPSRMGEDLGFLRKMLYQIDENQVIFIDQPVYYWHNREGSIMRPANKHKLKYVDAPKGIYENLVDVTKYFYDRKNFSKRVFEYILGVVVQYYMLYDASLTEAPEESEKILTYAKDVVKLFVYMPPVFILENEAKIHRHVLTENYMRDMPEHRYSRITYEEFRKLVDIT